MNRIIETPKYRVGGGIKGNTVKHSISSDGLNHVDLSYYMQPKGTYNLALNQILVKTQKYTYRDINTNLPFETKRVGDCDEMFFSRVWDLWIGSDIKLEVASAADKNYTMISKVDDPWNSKFMEIICKDLPLESVRPSVHNMIWDGYSENIWDYFKPQFDDPSNLIEGVFINPAGFLVLRPGADILKLDKNTIIDFMTVGGIICKKSSITYKFWQDFIARQITYKTLE